VWVGMPGMRWEKTFLKIDKEWDFGYSCDKTMALPHLVSL
jgi:hypothetical protein